MYQAQDDGLLLSVHDINVNDGRFTGELTITIPVGTQYNGRTVSILHCKGGILETLTAAVTDGKVIFRLNSLSPIAIVLPAADTAPPILTGGSSERTSDTSAQILFTTDEAGAIYCLVLDSGVPAPAKETVKNTGDSLGAIAGTGLTGGGVTLTAGTKDVYVVMEDAAGNISESLKIPVAAYNPAAAQAITGVTSPAVGATPSTAINGGTGFTAALWWDGNPSQFDYGTVYTAFIVITQVRPQ